MLDPQLLMWFQRRHIHHDHLPPERLVVRFTFRCANPLRVFWLILQRPDADLCLRDPGLRVNAEVIADLDAMVDVYLGRRTLVSAVRDGTVEIVGPPTARTTLLNCLGISKFAPAPPSPPAPAAPAEEAGHARAARAGRDAAVAESAIASGAARAGGTAGNARPTGDRVLTGRTSASKGRSF